MPRERPDGAGDQGAATAAAARLGNRAQALRERVLAARPRAQVVRRERNAIELEDPDDGRRILVAAVAPLHYQDAGAWQEIDTTVQDSADPAFDDEVDRAPYRVRVRDGNRRVWPRRDVPDEYIDFGRPEFRRANGTYAAIPWDGRRREGATVTFYRADAELRATFTGGRLKIELVLTAPPASTRWRFPVSIAGLTRQGARIVSNRDGQTVATVAPFTLQDAAGIERAVAGTFGSHPTYQGAYTIEPDLSGLTFPVTIDPTIDTPIGAGANDGSWTNGGTFAGTGTTIPIGNTGNNAFLRYTGISALHQATIDVARLELISSGSFSGSTTNVIVKAAAVDNAAAPTTAAECTSPTRTTATVSWNSVPSWTSGTQYNTPSIVSIVQEMADNGYLSSGVGLFYIEDNSSTAVRRFKSYEHGDGTPADLYVEYTTIVEKNPVATITTTITPDATLAITEGKSADATIATTIGATSDLFMSEAIAGDATLATTITPALDSLTIEGTADATLATTIGTDPSIAAELDADATVATTIDAGTPEIAQSVDATIAATITVSSVERRIIPITYEPRLAVDVYDLAGNVLGSGPIVGILTAEYSGRLDEIGDWRLTVDATATNADQLVEGREVRIRREGEGLLFRGVIDQAAITVGAQDDRILEASGRSIAAQLVWANTLLGRTFSGDIVTSAVGTLISGTGWSAGTIDAGTLISARFDGASVWKALREVARVMGWHVREDNLSRNVDLGEAGGSSGLVFRAIEHPDADLGVVPLLGLRIAGEDTELWNRVVPLGAGEGVNVLTLEHSGRSTPYTIQTATGPDGNPYWYLEDAASIASYGARTQIVKLDDIAPLSNAAQEIEDAADVLYDVAAAWLGYHAAPAAFYEATVGNLRHIEAGSPTFRLGETARLQWNGIVEDESGRRQWRSVDATVYVMGYRRSFNPDGSDTWDLELATVDRHAEGAGDRIAQAIEDIWAIQTAMKPFTYREIHGPYRESVNASNDARITVDFDDTVTYLHRAELRLVKRRVKSNVSTMSSGGGQTSSDTVISANSGGGQTSGGGTSHSHGISATIAQADGAHWHSVAQFQPTSSWTDPAYMQQLIFNTSPTGSPSYGVYVGRNGTEAVSGTLVTQENTTHTHNITATSTVSEGSHTHSVSAHTHTINAHSHTVTDHTHALTYGIYEGPAASAPQFGITINGTDRTAALGGPWDDDIVLDITPYLTDANGHVLRQANTILISSAQLCDVELTVKSLVTALSLVPA